MKARLVADAKTQHLVLLCADGTIAPADDTLLYNLFSLFNRGEDYFSGGSYGVWQTESCPDMTMYPGTTIAYIADNNALVMIDSTPFMSLINFKVKTRSYISTAEFAQKYDKSTEIVKVFCRNGRIPGAKKIGRNWLIPEDAEYPVEEAFRREGVRGPRPHMRKKRSASSGESE